MLSHIDARLILFLLVCIFSATCSSNQSNNFQEQAKYLNYSSQLNNHIKQTKVLNNEQLLTAYSNLSNLVLKNTSLYLETHPSWIRKIHMDGYWTAAKLSATDQAQSFLTNLQSPYVFSYINNEYLRLQLESIQTFNLTIEGENLKAKARATLLSLKALNSGNLTQQQKAHLIAGPIVNVFDNIGDRESALNQLDMLFKASPEPFQGDALDWLLYAAEEGEILSVYLNDQEKRRAFKKRKESIIANYNVRNDNRFKSDLVKIIEQIELRNFDKANQLLEHVRRKFVPDSDVRHRAVDFVHHIARMAKNRGENNWYKKWMLLASEVYTQNYLKRVIKYGSIPAYEKNYLSEFVIDFVQIEDVSTDEKFKIVSIIQELQIAYSGFRAKKERLSQVNFNLNSLKKNIDSNSIYLSYLHSPTRTLVMSVSNQETYFTVSNTSSSNITDSLRKQYSKLSNFKLYKDDPEGNELYLKLIDLSNINNQKIKNLIINPSRELSSFPIAALNTTENKAEWLIERYSIQIVPSSRFIKNQTVLEKFKESHFIGIGAPRMGIQMQDEVLRSPSATNLSPLPDAEEELKELSAYFRDSSLAIGNKATESEWLRLVQTDPEVISLATHSIQPTNSKFTGLLLNNDEDNDGIITYEEISSNQYLSAKLVILSACNTANTTEYKFQEAYKGLASGFIGAGAKNILVTHWPVYSVAAKELVTSTIYDDANTFAKRLQNSMKKLASSSNTLKSQPIYWAAFSLIGSN